MEARKRIKMKINEVFSFFLVIVILAVAFHIWTKQMELMKQMELRLAALVPTVTPVEPPRSAIRGFAPDITLA